MKNDRKRPQKVLRVPGSKRENQERPSGQAVFSIRSGGEPADGGSDGPATGHGATAREVAPARWDSRFNRDLL